MNQQKPAPLDGIDRTLLEALQNDCKQSLATLGERVHLSPASVMERIRKLEALGVVKGYYAQLDARRVGLDIAAFIGVVTDHSRNINSIEDPIAMLPGVLECHHVTGPHSLIVKVRTENTESLTKIISAIRAVDGVARTETNVILSTNKESFALTLPEEEPELHDSAKKRVRRSPGISEG